MKAQPRSTALRQEETPPVSPRKLSTRSTTSRSPFRRAFSFSWQLLNAKVRLRFRLRAWLTAMTILSLTMGLLSAQARRSAKAITKIQDRGGIVLYDTTCVVTRDTTSWRLALAEHLGGRLGSGWLRRPAAVVFPAVTPVNDEALRLVSRLGSVRVVHVDGSADRQSTSDKTTARTAVTDRGLAYLKRLPNLRRLTLCGSSVTPIAMAEFRARHPACRIVENPNERVAFFKL